MSGMLCEVISIEVQLMQWDPACGQLFGLYSSTISMLGWFFIKIVVLVFVGFILSSSMMNINRSLTL